MSDGQRLNKTATKKITIHPRNRALLFTCVLSALISLFIVLMSFVILGFAPFGNHSLTYYDGEIQLVDLLCWYKDVLTGKSSIDFTFTKYLGGSNFAVFTYYLASPLNILMIFFDKTQASLFMNVLFLLKTMLAAVFADYYLFRRFNPDTRLRYALTVILSVSYGLNMYMITESSTIMWLDGAYMLPLMLAGVEKLVAEKKSTLFILSSALALCFNWYSGIIALMFACFWFLFESARRALNDTGDPKSKWKYFGASVVRMFLAGVATLLSSAVVLLPTLTMLSGRTYGSAGGISMLKDLGFIGFVPNIISNYSFGIPSIEGSVNLFAGTLVFMGVVLLFIASSKALKEKLFYGIFLLFIVLMFYWQPLVAVFSMFREVESFWYRYGFAGSFALVVLAAVFFLESDYKKLKAWMPLCISLVYSLVVLFMTKPDASSVQDNVLTGEIAKILGIKPDYFMFPLVAKISFSVVIAIFFSLAIGLYKAKKEMFRLSGIVLSLILLVEFLSSQMVFSSYFSTNNNSFLGSYTEQELALLGKIEDTGFYRTVQTSYHSSFQELPASYNEPMAYGFNSVTSFVSAPEENVVFFMERAGYSNSYDTIPIVTSENLAIDSLMSVKYVILPSGDQANSGLQYVDGVDGFKDLYLNPYSVPVAFVTNHTGDYENDGTCPAVYMNNLYSYLSGIDNAIYIPVDKESVTVEEHMGDSESGEKHSYDYSISADNESVIYANLVTDSEGASDLYINGEFSTKYSTILAPSMVRVPVTEGTAKIGLVLNDTDNRCSITDPQFYQLDLQALDKSTEAMKLNSTNVITMEDGHCVFEIENASEGSSLFSSITNNKGWTVTRNGKKIDYDLICDTFISVPLENGKNVIEFTYRVPCKTAGIIASLAGIILLSGITILENKKVR